MVAPSSSTVRVKRLHELVDRALDTTVTSLGGAKEFTRCFAVGDAERAFLATAYDEALGKFRANVKVRAASASQAPCVAPRSREAMASCAGERRRK